jgi:hypothetical protein
MALVGISNVMCGKFNVPPKKKKNINDTNTTDAITITTTDTNINKFTSQFKVHVSVYSVSTSKRTLVETLCIRLLVTGMLERNRNASEILFEIRTEVG